MHYLFITTFFGILKSTFRKIEEYQSQVWDVGFNLNNKGVQYVYWTKH